MPLTSTWPAEDGDCALDDLVQQPATHGTAPHDLATRVKLLKPSNSSNNCVITFTPPQPGSWTALALTSTARTVEVSAQSAGGAMSYITTVRAQSLAGSTWQKATVPLKASPHWEVMQLKLLSLQGDRSSCSIAALHLIGDEAVEGEPGLQQQHSQQALPGERQPMPPNHCTTVQQPPPLSQLDELQLLVTSIQQQGCAPATAPAAVPASLEFLYSKAVQQPGGAAATMKSLSAAVAQGMLLQQAADKRHAAKQQADRQRHRQPGDREQYAESSLNTAINNLASTPLKAADADVCGDVANMQAVLQAVHRVEDKLDELLGFVQQLALCLKTMDGRMAVLERQSGGSQQQ